MMGKGHLKRTITLAAWAVLLGLAGAARGKTPASQIPQFDNPEYWDAHAFAYAEVQVHEEGTDPHVRIVEQFAGASGPGDVVVKLKEAWLEPWAGDIERPVSLDGYDGVFIVNWDPAGKGTVVIYKPGDRESAALLAESCRRIQAIRRENDVKPALAAVVKASDAVAQRYVLNVLLGTDLKTMEAPIVEMVKALRADPVCEVHTRMLASGLLQRISVARGGKKDDWEWIAGVLRNESAQPGNVLSELMERMLTEDGDQPQRTADLFCALGGDETLPLSLRLAVMAPGDLDRLIDRDDGLAPRNIQMLNFALARLKDSSPPVRLTAAGELWHFMDCVAGSKSPAAWRPWGEKVVNGLRAAEAQEVAEAGKLNLSAYRERVDRMILEHVTGK